MLRGRWVALEARTFAKGEPLCSTAQKLPHYYDNRTFDGYCKAVERQEAYNRFVGVTEERRQVVAWHDDLSILHADALHEVADGGSLKCCVDVGL